MQALVWDGRSLRYDASHPVPVWDGRMVTVRVRFAGICSTDLQILKGYMGFRGVPGHEFVGEVREGPGDLVGKRVVGEINFACGTCRWCAHGLGRHCPSRRVMGILGADGSFAEYVAVPAKNLHVVPPEVSDEEAVFTEPLAAAFEILEQVNVQAKDKVLVFGDGKLGILCSQVLALTGAQVTLIGKHEKKLGIVRGLGIPAVLLSDVHEDLADVVVEATGAATGLELALKAVRPRGTLVLKSTLAGEHGLSLAPLVINELTLVGSRCGLFAPALEALAQKRVAVTPLIEKSYPLIQGLEAVAHACRRGSLKVLLHT